MYSILQCYKLELTNESATTILSLQLEVRYRVSYLLPRTTMIAPLVTFQAPTPKVTYDLHYQDVQLRSDYTLI